MQDHFDGMRKLMQRLPGIPKINEATGDGTKIIDAGNAIYSEQRIINEPGPDDILYIRGNSSGLTIQEGPNGAVKDVTPVQESDGKKYCDLREATEGKSYAIAIGGQSSPCILRVSDH